MWSFFMIRAMRAVLVNQSGPSSVMNVVSTATIPTVAPNDVLVKNAFAGVNFIDTYQRSGIYPLKVPILGLEGAGEIVSLGESVGDIFKIGDLVAWPSSPNSYAEYVSVPFDKLCKVPVGVSLDTACAAMLQDDWILVHAASGGVGLILTQMIKARGAHVIGTCSTEEKAVLAREAGADAVIVGYENFTARTRDLTGGKGVHAVFDGVGKDTFVGSLDSLRPRGMMVLFGGASGQVPPFDLQGLNSRGSLSITRPSLAHFIATPDELQWRAGEIFSDIVENRLRFSIGKIYPIEDVVQAHDDLEGRRTTGKLLLRL